MRYQSILVLLLLDGLAGLFPKGESSPEPMALCHMNIGSLSRQIDTLFTPAHK